MIWKKESGFKPGFHLFLILLGCILLNKNLSFP